MELTQSQYELIEPHLPVQRGNVKIPEPQSAQRNKEPDIYHTTAGLLWVVDGVSTMESDLAQSLIDLALERSVRFTEEFMGEPLPTNFVLLFYADAVVSDFAGHNTGFSMTVHPDFDSEDDLTVSGVPVPLIALSVTENASTGRLPTPHLEIANALGVSSDSTGFSYHLRSVDSPALPLPITCSAYRWSESWGVRRSGRVALAPSRPPSSARRVPDTSQSPGLSVGVERTTGPRSFGERYACQTISREHSAPLRHSLRNLVTYFTPPVGIVRSVSARALENWLMS